MKWRDATLVGFDTETSGKYPLDAELCEIAAVKWRGGQIVEEFQSLVSVKRPMNPEAIGIHNITDEMVKDAPSLEVVVRGFHKFIEDSFLIAHHAPFDLGFIAPEFERLHLSLPRNLVFCSSLFTRKAITDIENHRLKTLLKYLSIEQGQAHRALDDARACLQIAMKAFASVGDDKTIDELLQFQETRLLWTDYSLSTLRSHPVYTTLIEALTSRTQLQLVYSGGSRPGQPRTVTPMGLVRNPLDDYLVALEEGEQIPKRYFLNKITAARI